MTKLIQACAISALLVASAAAEETLRDRLAAYERFGVQTYEGTTAVVLHVYTAEQYEAHLAELRQYEEEKSKYNVERGEFSRRAIEIRERLRTGDSRAALEQMQTLRSEAPKKLREPAFVRVIQLHTKSSLGTDFIALTPHGNEESEILIPLTQIGRVVFKRDAGRTSGTDGPTSSSSRCE